MRNVLTIFGKEVGHHTGSAASLVVALLFAELSAAFFVSYLISTSYADTSIRGFVNGARFLIPLFAVFLTMRLFAGERRSGTWELLMTAPLRDHEIALGKFLGSIAFLAGLLAVTFCFPLLLAVFGDPDIGPIMTSYLALLLLGATCLAIGGFASATTASPLVAAAVATSILLALWLLGSAGRLVPGPLGAALVQLSPAAHLDSFFRGVIDSRDVIYHLSFTAGFLYLTTVAIALERVR